MRESCCCVSGEGGWVETERVMWCRVVSCVQSREMCYPVPVAIRVGSFTFNGY